MRIQFIALLIMASLFSGCASKPYHSGNLEKNLTVNLNLQKNGGFLTSARAVAGINNIGKDCANDYKGFVKLSQGVNEIGLAIGQPTLLIVDDDEEIRSQLKWALVDHYEVLMAEDRPSAITTFRDRKKVKSLTLNSADQNKYTEFIERLVPDHVVDVFYDANKDDGTLAQLAKIHARIKQLAMETGYSFEDMKLEVKRASGLCVKKEIGGEMFMVCKSFSRCSKEELSLAIQTLIELGDSLGSNLS